MIAIFLGPPGSGKGTQAQRFCRAYGWPQISTGDMLRAAMREGSETGTLAKNFMDRGLLVPDPIVVRLIEERSRHSDCQDGFILDGFPRNLTQVEIVDQMFTDKLWHLSCVVQFQIQNDRLVKRLSERRTCLNCSAMYHLSAMPPKVANHCDRCGSVLVHRDDDRPEMIHKRLSVYEAETSPLIEVYRARQLLRVIRADREPNQVEAELKKYLVGTA